ncbi:MAG: hypothetical protein CMC75_05130, partial [Flavobacteriaceae bacterium]|nr:hypothetical protein [Flavobacteriaceae bacterium]
MNILSIIFILTHDNNHSNLNFNFMKKITFFYVALLFLCCTWIGSAQMTYNGATGPLNDNGVGVPPGVTEYIINVPDSGSITDLTIDLDVTHTWLGDLDIELESPAGTIVALMDEPGDPTPSGAFGCNVDDILATFEDGGTRSAVDVETVCNPAVPSIAGSVEPLGLFSTFNGEDPNGDWILRFTDNAGGDSGGVNAIGLNITGITMIGDAPVITCPADIMINTEPGVCTAVSNFAGTATDTEDGNISGDIVATPASGSAFPVGTTAVTLSVTDSDGNTSTCMFNVTVVDNEDPVLTCPADIVQSNDMGVCGANVTVPMPTIMDNCPTAGGSPTQTSVSSPLTAYNFDALGLIDTPTTITGPAMASGDVEMSATFTGDHGGGTDFEDFILEGPDGSTLLDASSGVGDCATATLTFTVGAATWNGWIDTFGPDLTFVLQADAAVDNICAASEYQLTADYLTGSGLINDYNGTDDASDFYPVGDTDVTFTYVDGGGNTATCTMTVTVNDDEDPVITCAGDPAPIFGSATDAPGAAIPDNNPAGVSATIDITDDFDITDLNVDLDITHSWIGDLVVTLTAPDGTTAAAIIDRPGVPATGLGCNNTVNDILVTMDDEATDAIEGPCLTEYNGTFIPTEALSVFDGVSTLGTWTLTIVDNAGGDTGTLNNWTLNYEYIAVSNPLQVVLD